MCFQFVILGYPVTNLYTVYRVNVLSPFIFVPDTFICFLSPDPKRIGGYSDQPGVRPSVRLSVRLSVRRQKLVRSITFIPFEIF